MFQVIRSMVADALPASVLPIYSGDAPRPLR